MYQRQPHAFNQNADAGSHELRSAWRVDELVVVEVADNDDGTVAISVNLPGRARNHTKNSKKKGIKESAASRFGFSGGMLSYTWKSAVDLKPFIPQTDQTDHADHTDHTDPRVHLPSRKVCAGSAWYRSNQGKHVPLQIMRVTPGPTRPHALL